MVRLGVLTTIMVLAGSVCSSSTSKTEINSCPNLDLESEFRQNTNPAALLEDGEYLFIDGKPVSSDCLRKRVCRVNDFTREHFGQSYYISLDRPGGAEIKRQFPEIVNAIVEGRGNTRVIYLNNFCAKLEAIGSVER